jgi:uridine kinase
VVIAITGPSAAGKTTLATLLATQLPAAVHLQQDWFFRDPDTYPPDANFYEPRWLHAEEFLAAFAALAAGEPTVVPRIDFQTFRRTGTRHLAPAQHLIVEGMTILRIPEIYHRCHTRYYLDPGLETIAHRKRHRDLHERGKTPEIIEAQLGWIQTEYHADHKLRTDPAVTVVTPATLDQVLASWTTPNP